MVYGVFPRRLPERLLPRLGVGVHIWKVGRDRPNRWEAFSSGAAKAV